MPDGSSQETSGTGGRSSTGEASWSNGKAAYRCRHGRTSAMAPDPARPKNTYVREDKLLPHLQALHLLLATSAVRARRRTRAGADVRDTASPGEVIAYDSLLADDPGGGGREGNSA